MALFSSPAGSPVLPDLPTLPFENVPDLPPYPAQDSLPSSTSLSSQSNLSNAIDLSPRIITSSDPPLYSRDGLLTSSAENYLQPNTRKRQFRGQWWDEHEVERSAKRIQVEHKGKGGTEGERASESRRGRGPFLRCWDSGVWLGSDDSVGDQELDHQTELGEEERRPRDAGGTIEEVDGVRRGSEIASSEEDTDAELRELALENADDSGRNEEYVWPYWQPQPEDLGAFHQAQGIAVERVIECVEGERGEVDLS